MVQSPALSSTEAESLLHQLTYHHPGEFPYSLSFFHLQVLPWQVASGGSKLLPQPCWDVAVPMELSCQLTQGAARCRVLEHLAPKLMH